MCNSSPVRTLTKQAGDLPLLPLPLPPLCRREHVGWLAVPGGMVFHPDGYIIVCDFVKVLSNLFGTKQYRVVCRGWNCSNASQSGTGGMAVQSGTGISAPRAAPASKHVSSWRGPAGSGTGDPFCMPLLRPCPPDRSVCCPPACRACWPSTPAAAQWPCCPPGSVTPGWRQRMPTWRFATTWTSAR